MDFYPFIYYYKIFLSLIVDVETHKLVCDPDTYNKLSLR